MKEKVSLHPCIHTHIYTYIHIYTYTHTYIHIHIYTYRMWDMSTVVMIALISLHSDEILYFGAYKIFVTHLSRDSYCYSGIYECRIRV